MEMATSQTKPRTSSFTTRVLGCFGYFTVRFGFVFVVGGAVCAAKTVEMVLMR